MRNKGWADVVLVEALGRTLHVRFHPGAVGSGSINNLHGAGILWIHGEVRGIDGTLADLLQHGWYIIDIGNNKDMKEVGIL